MISFVSHYAEDLTAIRDRAADSQSLSLADVRLDCPVDWPNKVIAFPANYHAHIEEQKVSKSGLISKFAASGQGFFLKANSSLSGPNDPIVIPPLMDREVHHECELAITGASQRSYKRVSLSECCINAEPMQTPEA